MAKVRTLQFDDDEHLQAVTLTLTLEEAVYLASLLGKQSGTTANEVMRDGDVVNSEVYSALAGGVFNRFYDGGVDDARRDLGR